MDGEDDDDDGKLNFAETVPQKAISLVLTASASLPHRDYFTREIRKAAEEERA